MPPRRGLLTDAVFCIEVLHLLGRVELFVEMLQGASEARAVAVLVVEIDSAGDDAVADCVAVGEVLGDDARAGFVFL